MTILRSIIMALSLFTRIPMPTLDWQKNNMSFALAALPLIGLIIGALYCLWFWVCSVFAAGTLFFAVGLTLIPVLVTGGIHLDGFCDTVDALSSRASKERKREILKDPHAGVFAIIGIAVYLLISLALYTELERSFDHILLLGSAVVLSRALGGLASLVFPTTATGNLLDTLRDKSSKRVILVLIVWAVLAFAFALYINLVGALVVAAAALLVTLYVRVMSQRQFGGISGDLIGYLIQLVELFAVAALVCLEKVMMLL